MLAFITWLFNSLLFLGAHDAYMCHELQKAHMNLYGVFNIRRNCTGNSASLCCFVWLVMG